MIREEMWTNIKHVCFMYTFANLLILKGSSGKYFLFCQDVHNWKRANESCSDLNGALIRIKDLETFSSTEGEKNVEAVSPFWSSVTGLYTPWIAYRGCYSQPRQDTAAFALKPNTVGNCFSYCKNQATNPNSCEYFALSGEICYCPCTSLTLQLADSDKCNITCNNSTDDGYCGGTGYITLYQVNNIFEGDGFCLAYNCGSRGLLSSGHDCDDKHKGYCVDGQNTLLNQSSSSWNDYAIACKEQKLFLTAYIQAQLKNMICHDHVWTGIRKYKIHDDNGEKDCFAIKKKLGLWLYEKVNCSFKRPFLCQTYHIQGHSTTSISPCTELLVNKSDATTSSLLRRQSQRTNRSLVAGSITGVAILITVTLLTFHFIKRKRKSVNHTAPPVHNSIYDILESEHAARGQKDTFYMNTVAKDTKNQEQFNLQGVDNVYVEKADGECDHLRSTRPKPNKAVEESQYDRSENAYSTTTYTREGQNVEIYGSHYDSMTNSSENYCDSKSNQDNIYGSHSPSVGSPYDSICNKSDVQETS